MKGDSAMCKLKKSLFILIIVAGSALLFSGWAQAVEIVYYSGDIYTKAAAQVEHDDTVYDGGGTPEDRGHDAVPSGGYTARADMEASATNATTQATGHGGAGYNIEYGNYLTMFLGSSAGGRPQEYSPGDSGWGNGSSSTVDSRYTNGIFFQLLPTEGYNEDLGDPVQVTFQFFYNLGGYGGGGAKVTGGDDQHQYLALTVGYLPGSIGYYLDSAEWTHEKIEANGQSSEGRIDGEFTAYIGNIIGIFLGVSSEVNFDHNSNGMGFNGDINLQIQANTPSDPSPVPLPGAVWLLGTGLAGLLALGGRRRRRG
jgi:hypothetical protein